MFGAWGPETQHLGRPLRGMRHAHLHFHPWGATYTSIFDLHLHFRPWGAPYTSIFDLHLHFRPWGAHYTSIFDIIRP